MQSVVPKPATWFQQQDQLAPQSTSHLQGRGPVNITKGILPPPFHSICDHTYKNLLSDLMSSV